MDLISSKWKGLVKAYKHYMNPNQNPTQYDKIAFDLLNKGQVDQFIDYCQSYPVNVNVQDFSTVSLLIKAQDVANDTSACKKLLSQQERIARAIKATSYLLQKGVDINYRDKSGGTALYAAVHWNNFALAQLLLKKGADPNLGSTKHFINLPLISATFKQNQQMIILLISYGADVDEVYKLCENPTGGLKLTNKQKQLLRSASNLQMLIRRRRYEMALKKQTVLALLSQKQFQQICFYL